MYNIPKLINVPAYEDIEVFNLSPAAKEFEGLNLA